MRALLDNGVWPTATALNRVNLRRGNGFGRPDLNGRELATRNRLAAEYGWRRVAHGRADRWEKA